MSAPELILNLADWIERRKKDVGPYADYIIHSVRHYEAEIERLRQGLAAAEILGNVAGAERKLAEARNSGLEAAAKWHLGVAEHDAQGMEYSSLVGIAIDNWDVLDTSVRTHEWCAREIRALKTQTEAAEPNQ